MSQFGAVDLSEKMTVSKYDIAVGQLRSVIESHFVRSVFTVASGAVATQAISMAFSPFLTRMYGPEAFGLQTIFSSVVGLLGVVATMGYPTAIVIPRHDAEAINLAKISILIASVFCVLTAVIIGIFKSDILRLFNAQKIADFIYLVPPAIFIGALGSVFSQWLIRKKAFGFSVRSDVFTSIFVGGVKCGLGAFSPSAGNLILTNAFGSFLSMSLAFMSWRRLATRGTEISNKSHQIWNRSSLLDIGRKYYDFPLLRTPQNLINAFSQNVPVFWLATFSGASAPGQYAMAVAVLRMPINLIGGAVMTVFYPRINEAIHGREDVRALILRATIGMAITGIIPILSIAVAGPWLFQLVFGEGWGQAGEYSRWLSPWFFFQYINKPAVAAIPALNLQAGLLIYEVFSTGTKIFALWCGFVVFESDVAAVALFSVSGTIAYIWLIVWVIWRSKNEQL